MSGADHGHFISKSNSLDPDEGNSKLCSACNLPIFATPFIISDGGVLLHDQCVDLPEELKACGFHPEKPLLLHDNHQSSSTCSKCSRKCGKKLYSCPDSDCGLILDVACALPVKILHRSHLEHRLTAIRGGHKSCFGTCGVCGVLKHDAWVKSRTSYFCVVCGFWIHPKCARLPYVIQHEKHEHSLVLYYDVALNDAELGEKIELKAMKAFKYFYHKIVPQDTERCKCAICGHKDTKTFGVYSCIDPQCGGYYIHIKCAFTLDHGGFKAVLGRDAKFGDLIRLPIPNEHRSYLEQTTKNSTEGLILSNCDHQEFFHLKNIKVEDGDGDKDPRHELVCDACVKVINKPPFYSCKECPNLLFHHYCRSLPDYLTSHPAHTYNNHRLILILSRHLIGRICSHCRCSLGRAFYMCGECGDEGFVLDASCALMTAVVTHDEHASMHFLHLSESSGARSCDCCRQSLGELGYECWTCPNFALHTWCAMLPKTVTHKFDPHPLRLISSGVGVAEICEICENSMDDKVWYYGCKECDQWFHIDCIPCLDLVHKIKSVADQDHSGVLQDDILPNQGFDYEKIFLTRLIGLNYAMSSVKRITQELHHGEDFPTRFNQVLNHRMNLPTRLVRGLTLHGHGHGDDYCKNVADEYDVLASD